MLTLFAIPKPFRGHIGIIQRNAIQSWKRSCPGCEIILFGSDEGTKEVVSEFGVVHVPEVATNEYGTPLVSDLFEKAQSIANYDVLAYVNADVILMSDFVPAVRDISGSMGPFLMIGRRWGLNLPEPWDFDSPQWESRLWSQIQQRGSLGGNSAMDYFVFSRDVFGTIPPFAIGRMAWDNWLVLQARKRSAAVVDTTDQVTAVHQNHDYGSFGSVMEVHKSEEGQRNKSLLWADGYSDFYDVTHVLFADGIRSAWSLKSLLNRPRRLIGLHPLLGRVMRPRQTLVDFRRFIRSTLSDTGSGSRRRES